MEWDVEKLMQLFVLGFLAHGHTTGRLLGSINNSIMHLYTFAFANQTQNNKFTCHCVLTDSDIDISIQTKIAGEWMETWREFSKFTNTAR